MASRGWTLVGGAALAVLTLFSGGHARAQEPEPGSAERELTTAQTFGREGLQLYQKGEFQAAADKLETAFRLAPVPTIGLWLARSLVELGRLVEAKRYLDRVSEMKMADVAEILSKLQSEALTPEGLEVHEKAIADAQADRKALAPRIPSVELVVTGATDVTVTIDDKPRADAGEGPVPLDPGTHRIVVRHGDRSETREVQLAEGATVRVQIAFATAAPAPTRPPEEAESRGSVQATLGYVALGVGAAALVAGGVMGIVALTRYNALECPEDRCGPDFHDDADRYNALRIPSGAMLIAGGVVAAAGLVIALTAPDEAPDVGLFVGPGSLSLTGRF